MSAREPREEGREVKPDRSVQMLSLARRLGENTNALRLARSARLRARCEEACDAEADGDYRDACRFVPGATPDEMCPGCLTTVALNPEIKRLNAEKRSLLGKLARLATLAPLSCARSGGA